VVKKPFQVGPDWGILVFKEYRAAPLDGFQQDKERFSQALLQQKRSTLIEDWARSLREKAKISINQDLI
jgi:parvulin-like peptidyl-prolyl isomerase